MTRFFLILFATIGFNVALIKDGVAQDAPAKSTPVSKSSTPAKKEAKGEGPRIKTPMEIAYDLCVSANSLKKLGKHEDAIKTYTEALETYPDYYIAFLGRAGSKFLKLDFQGALSDYSAGIDMMENMIEQHQTQAKIKKSLVMLPAKKLNLMLLLLSHLLSPMGTFREEMCNSF